MDIKKLAHTSLSIFIRRPLPNCARRLPRRQEARAYGQVRSTRRADENRIPATPEDQTARPGGQLGAFMGRLLTLGHFHGITALLAKVGQQPLQPLGGEIVAPGMGNHRLAARMMNHINRLFYCTPLRRHVTGFPAGKVFFEDFRHVFRMAGLHQKTGKMAAGDGATVRQSQRPFPGRRGSAPSPGARQSSDRAAGAALSAPPAGRSSLGAQYQYSDPQYESRDSPKGWKSRRRSPGSRVIRRGRSPPGPPGSPPRCHGR